MHLGHSAARFSNLDKTAGTTQWCVQAKSKGEAIDGPVCPRRYVALFLRLEVYGYF